MDIIVLGVEICFYDLKFRCGLLVSYINESLKKYYERKKNFINAAVPGRYVAMGVLRRL